MKDHTYSNPNNSSSEHYYQAHSWEFNNSDWPQGWVSAKITMFVSAEYYKRGVAYEGRE